MRADTKHNFLSIIYTMQEYKKATKKNYLITINNIAREKNCIYINAFRIVHSLANEGYLNLLNTTKQNGRLNIEITQKGIDFIFEKQYKKVYKQKNINISVCTKEW
jgi:predicted transcriptional regulator